MAAASGFGGAVVLAIGIFVAATAAAAEDRRNVTRGTETMADRQLPGVENGTRIEAEEQRHRRQLTTTTTTTTASGGGGNVTTESGFQPVLHVGRVPVVGTLIALPLDQQAGVDEDDRRAPAANRSRLRLPFNSLRTFQFENSKIEQKDDKKLLTEPVFRPSEQLLGDGDFVRFGDEDQDDRQFVTEDVQNGLEPIQSTYAFDPIYHHQYQHPVGYQPSLEGYASGHQQYIPYENKPTKLQDAAVGYVATPVVHHQPIVQNELGPYPQYQPEPLSKPSKPDTIINVHPVSFQSSTFDSATKPKTVIYVTTHDSTGNRKPPGNYYPAAGVYEQRPETADEYPLAYEPHLHRSISPWKKILHVIGTLLPFGLLFALLLPKHIVHSNHSDVFSRFRGVSELLPEHKYGSSRPGAESTTTTTDGVGACTEERSICRMVAAAEDSLAGSGLLRQLLIRATDRTEDSDVRKKELNRIFEAAKLGNCDILTCNFYDGT